MLEQIVWLIGILGGILWRVIMDWRTDSEKSADRRHELAIEKIKAKAQIAVAKQESKMNSGDRLGVAIVVAISSVICAALIIAVGGYYWSDWLEKKEAFERGYEQQMVRSEKVGDHDYGKIIWVKKVPVGLDMSHESLERSK